MPRATHLTFNVGIDENRRRAAVFVYGSFDVLTSVVQSGGVFHPECQNVGKWERIFVCQLVVVSLYCAQPQLERDGTNLPHLHTDEHTHWGCESGQRANEA